MNHTHCFKNTHHINLSTLPHPIDHTWEVTLRLPSWLFAFFRISRGLYIGLKLWLCTYQPGDDRNQLNLQAQFFCQGLGSLSLLNDLLEAGRLVLVWFWPNTEENLQGVIHLPTGSTLETAAPNTPTYKLQIPLAYNHISPPPPQLKALEASAQTSTLSPSSNETVV